MGTHVVVGELPLTELVAPSQRQAHTIVGAADVDVFGNVQTHHRGRLDVHLKPSGTDRIAIADAEHPHSAADGRVPQVAVVRNAHDAGRHARFLGAAQVRPVDQPLGQQEEAEIALLQILLVQRDADFRLRRTLQIDQRQGGTRCEGRLRDELAFDERAERLDGRRERTVRRLHQACRRDWPRRTCYQCQQQREGRAFGWFRESHASSSGGPPSTRRTLARRTSAASRWRPVV